jgi:hypothetical protein
MEENSSTDWQPAEPSSGEDSETPRMSEVSTLANIFFEPGNTFEDLRRKPRFIMALVLISLLVTAYGLGVYYKVGEAGVRRFITEQIDRNPRTESLSAEQKTGAVDMQMKIQGVVRYAMPVFVAVSLLLGGLLYWLAAKAFGGTGNFLHGLSVFLYSSIPPTVIAMIANFIILAFKSADDIDIAASQRGLVHANPGILLDGKTMPVLATLVGTLDIFMIWGWILAAIGLRITNRLSSSSAWAIVLIFALIGTTFRVVGAVFSGNPY